MDLTKQTVEGFTDLLSSGQSAPGGGAAAALVGVTGIALTSMVAALTIGREKYKDYEELMLTVSEEAVKLRADLSSCINQDAEAYDKVSSLFSMPRNTPEEKEAKSKAMEEALKNATVIPMNIMEYCLRGITLTEKAMGHSNPNAVSDLGVAALMLKAATQAAWLNILTNLSGIKDRDFADKYRKRGDEILSRVLPISYKIYDEIVSAQ